MNRFLENLKRLAETDEEKFELYLKFICEAHNKLKHLKEKSELGYAVTMFILLNAILDLLLNLQHTNDLQKMVEEISKDLNKIKI
jgi:arginyl-tRNA--protein-N-Asp/Glu arginylyltransferase